MSPRDSLRKYLLWPLIPLFAIGVAYRNMLYKLGILSGQSFEPKVIGIGNLNTGGTGKSPMTQWISGYLQKRGFSLAFISRGYGRETRGFLPIHDETPWTECGDEPWMFHQLYPSIPAVVCEDRVIGMTELMAIAPETEMVVADDVFQHRSLKPALQILLTTYQQPFFKDILLPAGNLREFKKGVSRAHAIVVTKCPSSLQTSEKEYYIKNIRRYSQAPIFFAFEEMSRPVGDPENIMEKQNVVLVTGIANASGLIQHLEKTYTVKEHFEFPDHHVYTSSDAEKIIQEAQQYACGIITTLKDLPRLQTHLKHRKIPLWHVNSSIRWEDEKAFTGWLISRLS